MAVLLIAMVIFVPALEKFQQKDLAEILSLSTSSPSGAESDSQPETNLEPIEFFVAPAINALPACFTLLDKSLVEHSGNYLNHYSEIQSPPPKS